MMMTVTPVVPVGDPEPEENQKTALNTTTARKAWSAGGSPSGGLSASDVIDLVNEPPRELPRKSTQKLNPASIFEFADSEAIKKGVRESLLRPDPYHVSIYYKMDGIWGYIATHTLFENVTLAVIAGNAVWMAVDTDWNKAKSQASSEAIFQIAEHSFCIYFSLELFVRFMAFKRKLDGFKDNWYIFDSVLVVMMVVETWVVPLIGLLSGNTGGSPLGNAAILRLFRLLRLSRLLRMLRSLPELMILVKGIRTAMKSVLYVMCLLVIILYVFAIAFTQMAVEHANIRDTYFKNVALSMYSLLVHGTFLDDLAPFCNDIRAESEVILFGVFIFIAFSSLTVMNMLIGVLCEVVSAVAATEKEMILTATVSEKMQGIVQSLDENSNGMISLKEFRQILTMPQALRALQEVGVDAAGVVDFAEVMFFEDSDTSKPIELPFEDFMEMILDLRSTNTATVRDIKYLWRQLNPKMSTLSKDISTLNSRAERIENSVDSMLVEIKKLVDRQSADSQDASSQPTSYPTYPRSRG